MTTIVVAAGLCSAIRPKLLTAFPPERHPNVKITAWGEGHWHIPCPDKTPFPDADPWVKKHIAHIDVTGDITYAKLIEYILCRLIEMERKRQDRGEPASHMYLVGKPLEPRNIKWAANWDSLPDPGEWRQFGCTHHAPKDTKPGISLGVLGALFGGTQEQPRRQRKQRTRRQRRT